MFTTPMGRPLDYSRFLSREWNPAVDRAGISPASPHSPRHASAAASIKGGVSDSRLARKLGHRDSRVTHVVYRQMLDEVDSDAAEVTGAVLLPADAEAMRMQKAAE